MTSISLPLSGGCACGAVRYESTAEPVLMLHCHCRDCQRATGGGHSLLVVVPAAAFRVLQGEPRWHASPSEAGGMTRRAFCPDCGAPVFGKPDIAPQIVALHAASMDDPSTFRPQMDVWTCDALPGDAMDPALPKFEKYPPMGS
jgi:hypothetical protein